MNTINHRKRLVIFGVSWVLAVVLVGFAAPAALASPPEDVLERARQAVAEGQEAAKEFADVGADSDGQKAQGLERAGTAIEAAAARKAEREGTEFPGKGRALGRGHAAEVHAILAAGGSPSTLEPHGQAVSTLAKAFERVKAEHPGQGEGLTKEKPAKGTDDSDEGESTEN